jgi:hypothetical protein
MEITRSTIPLRIFMLKLDFIVSEGAKKRYALFGSVTSKVRSETNAQSLKERAHLKDNGVLLSMTCTPPCSRFPNFESQKRNRCSIVDGKSPLAGQWSFDIGDLYTVFFNPLPSKSGREPICSLPFDKMTEPRINRILALMVHSEVYGLFDLLPSKNQVRESIHPVSW